MVISRYQKRLSGPPLDRIDIHVEVPRVPFQKLRMSAAGSRGGDPGAGRSGAGAAVGPVCRAKDGQGAGLTTNADMGPPRCAITARWTRRVGTLGAAMRQMNLSARAYHRVLKLARTIADLVGSERIQPAHLVEAIQYRPRRQE